MISFYLFYLLFCCKYTKVNKKENIKWNCTILYSLKYNFLPTISMHHIRYLLYICSLHIIMRFLLANMSKFSIRKTEKKTLLFITFYAQVLCSIVLCICSLHISYDTASSDISIITPDWL